MTQIAFETKQHYNPIRSSNTATTVRVMLDGKHVGTIKQVRGGWQYWPRGATVNTVGDVFSSLAECKASLV